MVVDLILSNEGVLSDRMVAEWALPWPQVLLWWNETFKALQIVNGTLNEEASRGGEWKRGESPAEIFCQVH